MTDLYAETPAPAPDLRDRLDYALAHIGDAELATVIATAGLAAVHDEWRRCRVDLAVQEDVARALALRIAHLTDEARRWKRRWAGAVAQGRHEHEAAEQLRADLADHQLAASEQQGAGQRLPGQGDRVRVFVEGEYHETDRGPVLTYQPGPNGMVNGFWSVPPSATVTVLGTKAPAEPGSVFAKIGIPSVGLAALGVERFVDLRAEAEEQLRLAAAEEAAHVDRMLLGIDPLPVEEDSEEVEIAGHTVRLSGTGAAAVAAVLRAENAGPCWCGHQVGFHVTDDSDNAVCRACIDDPKAPAHRALHVHTPEASRG